MSAGLRIASGLTLPPSFATSTSAILAMRRKGKTYLANVLAEEMVANEIPWVAFDPTGAWWGLRGSANGKRKGLSVLVIGGQHGQLPLERGAGAVLADMVVEHPAWYVFDLSDLPSKAAEREFATDFAERLYRRKAKAPGPLHVFVDEADLFVPQRSPSGDQRMLGAFEGLVRRGGMRGIGVTLVSQRAAVVNKNVLEQIDTLMVLRTSGPRDRKAIEEYVRAEGEDEQVAELMGSLASLRLGEAWVWSPGAEPPLFERVQVRERRTFNSSATATGADARAVALSEVDVERFRKQIGETIERVKRDDPVELRKQIEALRREAAAKEAEKPEPETVTVEVPVVDERVMGELRSLHVRIEGLAANIVGAADYLGKHVEAAARLNGDRPLDRARDASSRSSTASRAARPTRPPAPIPEPDDDGENPLGRAARTLLSTVAAYPEPLTRAQLSTLSGYKPRSSTLRNAISALNARGLIEKRGDLIGPSAAGREMAGEVDPPDREELIERWRSSVPQAPRLMLDLLLERYPDWTSREGMAEVTGYSLSSSTFRNALSVLRSNGLIEEDSERNIIVREELAEGTVGA